MWAYLALAGVQAIGGFQQADIIRQNGELQTNIDNMNAGFANYDANKATQAGFSRSAQYQDVIDSTNASVRGAYAGAGVTIGYGTAGEVTANNTVAGTVNSLQLQRQGQEQAMGYQIQGLNMNLAGSMAGYQADEQADVTQAQGLIQGATTGLAGLAQYMSSGKGQSSTSGTQKSQGGWSTMMKTVNMSVAPGAGAAAPGGVAAPPTLFSNGYGWYPDAGSSGPGYFGSGPRANGGGGNSDLASSAFGTYSFTSETQ